MLHQKIIKLKLKVSDGGFSIEKKNVCKFIWMFDAPKTKSFCINWGITQETTYKCGNSPAYSCYFSKEDEIIIISLTKIFKYKNGTLRDSLDTKITAGIYIPEYNIIICILLAGNRFLIIESKYFHHNIYYFGLYNLLIYNNCYYIYHIFHFLQYNYNMKHHKNHNIFQCRRLLKNSLLA